MKLRYSIRDLFLLTLVVALAVGWNLDHWTHSAGFREQQLEQKVDTLNQALLRSEADLRRLANENHELHMNQDSSGDQMPVVRPLNHREEQ